MHLKEDESVGSFSWGEARHHGSTGPVLVAVVDVVLPESVQVAPQVLLKVWLHCQQEHVHVHGLAQQALPWVTQVVYLFLQHCLQLILEPFGANFDLQPHYIFTSCMTSKQVSHFYYRELFFPLLVNCPWTFNIGFTIHSYTIFIIIKFCCSFHMQICICLQN